MKHRSIAILAAGLWIVFSEFIRNQFLLQAYWVSHYKSLGITFPSSPSNGFIWLVWSLVFATILHKLTRKFSFKDSVIIGWSVGFVMMWLVLQNLLVLPQKHWHLRCHSAF